MIPTKLKLSNFISYGENPPELDFTKFKMAAISGSNGSGKSSLLDSITWCLWGSSRAGDSSDDLVRLGADNMQVDFSFQLDSHEYSVKRRRIKKGGGSTALEFWSGNINLTEGTIKTTQQKIIDTLHLSFETFSNSSFLRQGHADEFTLRGPTDRKRILADILGLDHYDTLEEKAKDKSKEIQNSLSLIEYQLPEIEAELSQSSQSQEKKLEIETKLKQLETDIKQLEEKVKFSGEEKVKLVAASEQQLKLKSTFESLKQELNQITSDGQSRSSRIKTLKQDLEQLPKFEEKLTSFPKIQTDRETFDLARQEKLKLEKEISEVNGQLNLKLQQIKALDNRIEQIKDQLSDLKTGARCPTCGQDLDKAHKDQTQLTLQGEQKKLLDEKNKISIQKEETTLKSLQIKIAKVSFDEKEYNLIQQQLAELEKIRLKREELIKKQATLDSEEKVLMDLRSHFAKKKYQIDQMEQELKDLPTFDETINQLNQQLATQETQLTDLRSEEKIQRNILGEMTGLISRQEQMRKLKQELEDKKTKLSQDKELYEELSLAFGKKGIQAMIIEGAIPEIEEETNQLLDKLTEGRMKVSFETQRETKTKTQIGEEGKKERGLVETLDIIISDEMGERPYELYSGGETFRVNFAIRLAISKLMTHRSGARLQFLVIDEGFGTQDASGRTRLVEVIDTIKDDFEKILIITHLEELKEEFPVRIEVSKGASGSTFEVIGI